MATVTHYRELACWQLSVQLRDELIPITDRRQVKSHRKFCYQIEESSRSGPANIAEGFDRSSREFSRYLAIALGSLRETENHLDEALIRHFISTEEHERLRILAKRAIRASATLKKYLESRRD